MNKPALMSAAAGAAVFGAVGSRVRADQVAVARLAVCGGALTAVALIDLHEHRIPNRIVLPATAVCAFLAGTSTLRQGLPALALVGLLLALSLLQPASLGMGDVKSALLIAVALGAVAASVLVLGLALAALSGIAVTIRHGRAALAATLPLAPFLAAGALIALTTT